jgi:lysine biosynthesis protein LysW
MATVFCLECGATIGLDANTKVGQRLTCHQCRAELELLNASPPELDWAYDEPSDLWDSREWDRESGAEAVGQGQVPEVDRAAGGPVDHLLERYC